MHVNVNKTGGHDQPLGVDRGAAPQGAGAHAGDPAAADPNVAHGLQVGLRIDHGAAHDHDVVSDLLRQGLGPSPQQRGQWPHRSSYQQNGCVAQCNVGHGRCGFNLARVLACLDFNQEFQLCPRS